MLRQFIIFVIWAGLYFQLMGQSLETCPTLETCLSPVSSDFQDKILINRRSASVSVYLQKLKDILGEAFPKGNIIDAVFDPQGYFVISFNIASEENKSESHIKVFYSNDEAVDMQGDVLAVWHFLLNQFNIDTVSPKKHRISKNHPRNALLYLGIKFLIRKRVFPADKPWSQISDWMDIDGSVQYIQEELIRLNRVRQGQTIYGGDVLNIWNVSYEATPLIQKGGLANVSGELPRVLRNKFGHRSQVVLPFWGSIRQQIEALKLTLEKVDMEDIVFEDLGLTDEEKTFSVYRVIIDETPIYLLDNPSLFHVSGNVRVFGNHFVSVKEDDIYGSSALLDKEYQNLSGKKHWQHPLNAKRAILFSRASLRLIKDLSYPEEGENPDIIMTADWQSGLIPSLIKSSPEFSGVESFKKTKTVHTIHNLLYKGLFSANPYSFHEEDRRMWQLTGLPPGEFNKPLMRGGEYLGGTSLMKLGVYYADQVVTVSDNYAVEIVETDEGMGFQGIFKDLDRKLLGAQNGLPRREWDPARPSEDFVAFKWNPSENEHSLGIMPFHLGKLINKSTIQSELGLHNDESAAVFVFVGRFSEEKGLHLLLNAFKNLNPDDFPSPPQLIIAGSASGEYFDQFNALREEDAFKGRIALPGFVGPDILKKILAGSDIGVVPSLTEPSGLVQLQMFRFGVPVIANAKGGLTDTVIPFYNSAGFFEKEGNGFISHIAKASDLQKLMESSLKLYHHADPAVWHQLTQQTMENSEHYSWFETVKNVLEKIFYELTGKHAPPDTVIVRENRLRPDTLFNTGS